VGERKLAGLTVALAASAATMLVAGPAGSAVEPVTAPVVPVVNTAVVSDWVVLLVCLGYALAVWLVQAYRVVPPRDWLLERISYLEAQPGLSDPIKTDLTHIKNGIEGRRGWFLWVGVSKVQAGWRTVHAIEDDQLITLDSHKVNERLKTLVTRLAAIEGDEAKSFKERIDEALQPVSGAAALDLDGRRALLREASMFRHNYADSKYEDNAGLLGKALFLTLIALAIAVALAATFDRESWLLLGAAGGLISRLSRVARRRPSPSDYGAEWSSLILSPAGGAVAGWVGVLIMVALSNPPFDAVSNEFSELWDDPKKPLGLVLAFAFGFSERLFSRLTRSAADLLGGSLPEEETKK
jgi:hypothetical protein